MVISNQDALRQIKSHKKFQHFLDNLDFSTYPGLDLKKVFYFISTGTLVNDMPLEVTYQLMRDIKKWLNANQKGGVRKGAGRPKKNEKIVKITLSAEEKSILLARKRAENKGLSLQAMFRKWLEKVGKAGS